MTSVTWTTYFKKYLDGHWQGTFERQHGYLDGPWRNSPATPERRLRMIVGNTVHLLAKAANAECAVLIDHDAKNHMSGFVVQTPQSDEAVDVVFAEHRVTFIREDGSKRAAFFHRNGRNVVDLLVETVASMLDGTTLTVAA